MPRGDVQWRSGCYWGLGRSWLRGVGLFLLVSSEPIIKKDKDPGMQGERRREEEGEEREEEEEGGEGGESGAQDAIGEVLAARCRLVSSEPIIVKKDKDPGMQGERRRGRRRGRKRDGEREEEEEGREGGESGVQDAIGEVLAARCRLVSSEPIIVKKDKDPGMQGGGGGGEGGEGGEGGGERRGWRSSMGPRTLLGRKEEEGEEAEEGERMRGG